MARSRMFNVPLWLLRVTAAAMICAGVSACQTAGGSGLVASIGRAELSPTAASAIADDMVDNFADIVGPGTGTVVLKPDDSAFGHALTASLKRKGYAVATANQKPAGKAIQLAYVVDNFEGRVLARLSTASVDLGRVYTTTATGASPSSPLSVKRRG